MKLKAFPILLALSATLFAGTAGATQYPPGPGGACPTPLTIPQAQFGIPSCRPASDDTLFDVAGIVTAIKTNGTSRTFYMQARRSNQAHTGMDVFCGNFPPAMNLGDSVKVSGRITETGFAKAGYAESGETQMFGPDNINTTNDLVFTVLSSNNALPPYHTTSLSELKFPSITWPASPAGVVQPSFAAGEPWENTLVRLVGGPFVIDAIAYNPGVAINYPGIETRVGGGGGMLISLVGSGDTDSILVDMTSFVTLTPQPVGTKIDSVFGILQQRTRDGMSVWRIAIRSLDDIFYATPPNISDAFPVADDSLRVVFDRAVTAGSAENVAHYSLPNSDRSFDHVHMVGDDAAVLHIVNSPPLVDGDADLVRVELITGSVNSLTMTSPQDLTFINGVLPISLVQTPRQDSLDATPCVDWSRFAGQGQGLGPRLSFRGVCTAVFFGREYYVQEEGGGPRSGVEVFAPSTPLIVGHRYLIAAKVTEFISETEVSSASFIQDEGPVSAPPAFSSTIEILSDFGCDDTYPPGPGLLAVTNGEDYEGCLVTLSHLIVVGPDGDVAPPGGFFVCWRTAGGTGDSIEVNAANAPGYDPTRGDYLQVTGILRPQFGGSIFPRNDGDIVVVGNAGVGDPNLNRVTFSARPNPAQVAQLDFALPRRDKVELSVFDLFGRRIATVARGTFEAGAYTKRWDGRDDRGNMVGAGVFFYRLKVGSEVFNLRGVRMN